MAAALMLPLNARIFEWQKLLHYLFAPSLNPTPQQAYRVDLTFYFQGFMVGSRRAMTNFEP